MDVRYQLGRESDLPDLDVRIDEHRLDTGNEDVRRMLSLI